MCSKKLILSPSLPGGKPCPVLPRGRQFFSYHHKIRWLIKFRPKNSLIQAWNSILPVAKEKNLLRKEQCIIIKKCYFGQETKIQKHQHSLKTYRFHLGFKKIISSWIWQYNPRKIYFFSLKKKKKKKKKKSVVKFLTFLSEFFFRISRDKPEM